MIDNGTAWIQYNWRT